MKQVMTLFNFAVFHATLNVRMVYLWTVWSEDYHKYSVFYLFVEAFERCLCTIDMNTFRCAEMNYVSPIFAAV